ncbi:hypothetical protein [Bifidobacterium callitrichos]|uniref:Uncharacterized protein n=1 Tax=Bifidobacterium callitrichos DSM 23973 TaxID=1437609 RepID=A0A087A4Y2_9BIFI|nr:hypothetical protein [Bifidobacterium callitrichos]KFI53832.1 hypothetical protein BCAL_1646 [Bifidobacterium callitrichos DSM 23973]
MDFVSWFIELGKLLQSLKGSDVIAGAALVVSIITALGGWRSRPGVLWHITSTPFSPTLLHKEWQELKEQKPEDVWYSFGLQNVGDCKAAEVRFWVVGMNAFHAKPTKDGDKWYLATDAIIPSVNVDETVYIGMYGDEGNLMSREPQLLHGLRGRRILRVYWLDSPLRHPRRLRQDFELGSIPGEIRKSGRIRRVSRREFLDGHPSVDATRTFKLGR